MTIEEEFAIQFREFRKKAGLSQRALAKKVGVHHTYISRIENHNLGHTPSIKTLYKMATAMGMDEAELIKAANKLPPFLDPIMGDPDAWNFYKYASEMISEPEGWKEMKRILEEKVDKGEIE